MHDIPPGWLQLALAVLGVVNTVLIAWLHQRVASDHADIATKVQNGTR